MINRQNICESELQFEQVLFAFDASTYSGKAANNQINQPKGKLREKHTKLDGMKGTAIDVVFWAIKGEGEDAGGRSKGGGQCRCRVVANMGVENNGAAL